MLDYIPLYTFINSISNEITLEIASFDTNILYFIKEPNIKIKLIIDKLTKIKLNPYQLTNVNLPKIINSKNILCLKSYEIIQLEYLKHNTDLYELIKNPTSYITNIINQLNTINDIITNKTNKKINLHNIVQLYTVNKNALYIKYINNQNKETIITSINQNPFLIKFINNPSIELQILAVNKNAYTIYNINNPSEELQLIAVKKRSIVN